MSPPDAPSRNDARPRARKLVLLASLVVVALMALGFAALYRYLRRQAQPAPTGLAPEDYAVRVTATLERSPPSITLTWPAPPHGPPPNYRVFRKTRDAADFGAAIGMVRGDARSFVDRAVTLGRGYEYKVDAGFDDNRFGMLYAGLDLPLVEDRGRVLLLVAQNVGDALAPEIARLTSDLIGDGWRVTRLDVDPHASGGVADVRARITKEHRASPVRSLFLLGHIPVPYSGDYYPDGHEEHRGAWPADTYYGTLDAAWTDTTVNRTTAKARREQFFETGPDANHNVPGDGKFDQSSLPAEVAFEIGRVDMWDLPTMGEEIELLRRYLDKDHAFRHREGALADVPRRALVDDGSGNIWETAPAANGFRNFVSLLGDAPGIVREGRWLEHLEKEPHLLAYGCGYGFGTGFHPGPKGVDTIATKDFAEREFKAVFYLVFGSYFLDWDSRDNFMRAHIAAKTFGLASAPVAWPNWFFHPMALGEVVGAIARFAQNNRGAAFFRNSDETDGENPPVAPYVALMGDPTLRLHPVAPATAARATLIAATRARGRSGAGHDAPARVELTWTASRGPGVVGYYVYRAATPDGPFVRLTPSPIQATRWTDETALTPPTATYMIRALKLEQVPSGSYTNASQGAFASLAGSVTGSATAPTAAPLR